MAVLITGTNRGIGLALVKQFMREGYEVIATCRGASEPLRETGCGVIEGIDVGTDTCIEKLSQGLRGIHLEGVVNNAGLLERNSLEDLAFDSLARQFQVNALGPLRVVKAVLPFLQRGARIVMVTSLMGSIADNTSGGFYGYRMSKAALNMAGVTLARDLKDRGIAVLLVHPGYVKTRMTEYQGDVEPDQAARDILVRFEEMNLEMTGTFRHAGGGTLPW